MPISKRDLEFHVGDEDGTATTIFHDFNKAAGFAVSRSASTGLTVHVDVVAWTKAAARRWGGDASVEVYEADPEASVHERIVIKASALGRVA